MKKKLSMQLVSVSFHAHFKLNLFTFCVMLFSKIYSFSCEPFWLFCFYLWYACLFRSPSQVLLFIYCSLFLQWHMLGLFICLYFLQNVTLDVMLCFSSFFSSVGCADDEALTRLFQTSFLFVFWSLYQSW